MAIHLNSLELNPSKKNDLPPCVIFEDEDILVVNKPSGWNTHSPAPYAGEGIYEWLRDREPRWACLAIVHRLDKETSGLMVFGRSPRANRSLTDQFTRHSIRKVYACLTDRVVPENEFTVASALVRAGERYFGRPMAAGGLRAETHFRVVRRQGKKTWLEARPITGRTHQIRVHASESGFPLCGDSLYGGSEAPRLCLHSKSISLDHPLDGSRMEWTVDIDFDASPADELRRAIITPSETDSWRRAHGASDGVPGWYVDGWGDFWVAQNDQPEAEAGCPEWLKPPIPLEGIGGIGLYLKRLRRDVRAVTPENAGPEWVSGPKAPEPLMVCENGVKYELSFQAGYSVGLFLDQRDNRRRLLRRHVASGFSLPVGGELLNTFAYTCAFSVCGALAGARTTSLDLSRKYLDWGRRNFTQNGIDPTAHDFIYGDAFDWMHRLNRRSRRFDTIILDPPTFSRSRDGGDFRAEQDYGSLVSAAMGLLRPDGVLLASTNAARLDPGKFLQQVREAVAGSGRTILQEHYVPQPVDFPISRDEPAYLKTVWMRIR